MFENYYYPDDYYYREPEANSYVRILHASPNAPAVDVYANGNPIARNVTYREFTPYLAVQPGSYRVTVFPAGQTQNPVIDTNVNIPERSIITAAAIGTLPNIGLLAVPDTPGTVPQGKVRVRFVHLSPNTPNVDITLPNGTRLFRNVAYRGITGYTTIDPGVYTLQARPTGTENVALNVPNIRFKPNRFYTVYAVGLSGGRPPLQVLIPLDGNSYLKV